jgi:hypothetical protein
MDRITRAERGRQEESFRHSTGQAMLIALALVAMFVLIALFPEDFLLIIGGFTAVAGAGKLVVGHLEAGENDALPPASPAFRALADPKRPLTASDPISLAPPK